ncbi:MAG: cupin domain-containing protein [Gammaproteobacteria bacterium]|nr:cupin domain-containing protein [Gammaproteobacteria bacterium]
MARYDIEKDFVVLDPDKNATVVRYSPDLYEKLDKDFGDFVGHELISCFEFNADWPSWEIHPHGDEIVVLLAGSAVMLLDKGGAVEEVVLSRAGEYVVVPKGTWHTAHVAKSAKLLFVTPGQDTQNKYL